MKASAGSRAAAAIFDPKTSALVNVIGSHMVTRPRSILVVGCGSGVEAACLAEGFAAETIGVDIDARFDPQAARRADLRRGDATHLTFRDASFDLVFSYHALEHILDFRRALHEMRRVLRPRGFYMVGTPNRTRLLGYVGSKNATLRQKFEWNAIDWMQRLRGKFRNEYGAHAGFSAHELSNELAHVFTSVTDIALPYYRAIYPGHLRFIDFVQRNGLARFVFPSVYYLGQR